jgi:dTDP-4-amino-4,6-dideoxygalactose transaminase
MFSTNSRDLRFLHGVKRDEHRMRLSKSCIGREEGEAVLGVLEREFLGMGEDVRQFENLLAEFFGREAVCVNTGTAGLHLAIEACGFDPGSEILVPSLTYVASFQAITAAGMTPVACDVLGSTLTLDPVDAERRLTKQTKAIMPVHYAGGLGDLTALYSLAERCNLRVIEDAAHAFGSTYRGSRVGSFGDTAVFSFDGIKNITSGEGGCVVSSDAGLLERIKDARLLGVEKDTDKRFSGKRSWRFDVHHQGYRYHMSNIMAAIGIVQLGRFPQFAEARRRLAGIYQRRLSSLKGLLLVELDLAAVVPHIFPVRILDSRREQVADRLSAEGIQTGFHYQPNHLLTYFSDARRGEYPVTDAVFGEELTLPLHPDLRDEDVDRVCDIVAEVLDGE